MNDRLNKVGVLLFAILEVCNHTSAVQSRFIESSVWRLIRGKKSSKDVQCSWEIASSLLKLAKCSVQITTASHSQLTERLGLWQKKPLRELADSKQRLPGSFALLLEQRGIVYSSPHWHSKCTLTVFSHNQQVAIFMHVKVEGKLFMEDWT